MPTSKIKWSDLKVGILSSLALLILVTIVLKVGTSEKLFSPKYRLRTFVPNVQNLSEGAIVSLSGIKVGVVSQLELTQHHGKNGVIIWLEIDRAYRNRVTKSSVARVMTLGILGDKYVDITQGQLGEEPLKEGDFLKGEVPLDIGEFTDTAVLTLENLNAIFTRAKSIAYKLDQGEGVFGMLLNDHKFSKKVSRLLTSTADLLVTVKSNQGSFGLFLNDSSLYKNLATMTRNLSVLSKKLQAGEGSLGKLIADPSLYTNLESFSARADSLVYKMTHLGTTGRLLTDDQIYEEVAQLLNEMHSLMEDVRNHPQKYINLKVF